MGRTDVAVTGNTMRVMKGTAHSNPFSCRNGTKLGPRFVDMPSQVTIFSVSSVYFAVDFVLMTLREVNHTSGHLSDPFVQ